MDTDVAFVKEQQAAHERLANKYATQPARASMHSNTAHRFGVLAERISSLLTFGTPTGSPAKRHNVSLRDLDDLPPELISELSISDADRQEMIIEDIIEQNGGIISLDKLIIMYYRRTSEILKRNTLTSRLFRMVDKGTIYNVQGKRGYYSTKRLSDDDVQSTFGSPEAAQEDAGSESSADIISSVLYPRVRRRMRPPTLDSDEDRRGE